MELVRCQACIYIQFVCIHVFFSHVRVRCIVDGCYIQYTCVCVYSLTTLFAQFLVCLFACLTFSAAMIPWDRAMERDVTR